MSIRVQNIHKRFKGFVALNDVSLEVRPGELLALLGSSGCGKTTLLRVIAGLELPDSGTVEVDGENVDNEHIQGRKVGFVFQHYALFKHMTVFENVAFGLRMRRKEKRLDESAIRDKVTNLLRLVHLNNFRDHYPGQLSGGQRQRVALLRALAVEPKTLLLDEPFGALDAKVRKELRRWMRRLHDDMGITSIFVTHDQEEAMEVADRVVIMNQGRIEQIGTPEEVWQQPANAFVYDFLGDYNELDGVKDADGAIQFTNLGANQKTNVRAFMRPHEMWVSKTLDANDYLATKVLTIYPGGALVKLDLERQNGAIIQAEVPKNVISQLQIVKGDTLYVRPTGMKVFE